nr:hypothetical protein CPGR_06022 [Mycolicibacterium fortuitum subsp. fortuitum DSM 46621 = ATCC 6841 = JCM 6387]
MRSGGHAGHSCQPGHSLLDEDVARAAEETGRAGARDNLHRQNAVATEVEERVVDSDALESEHLGVDAGQDLFDGVRGRAVPLPITVVRGGQGSGVEFSVHRQRQCIQCHHRHRHHVGRQPLCQSGADIDGIGCAGEVSDQSLVAGTILASDHHCLLDALEGGKGSLDFAEFDSEAADLDLLVGPAQVLQLPVGPPAHQIAGAVHACSIATERAGNEPRGRQPGPAHVAVRDPRAGHVQLTDDSGGHRVQPLVEDEQRRPGNR